MRLIEGYQLRGGIIQSRSMRRCSGSIMGSRERTGDTALKNAAVIRHGRPKWVAAEPISA